MVRPRWVADATHHHRGVEPVAAPLSREGGPSISARSTSRSPMGNNSSGAVVGQRLRDSSPASSNRASMLAHRCRRRSALASRGVKASATASCISVSAPSPLPRRTAASRTSTAPVVASTSSMLVGLLPLHARVRSGAYAGVFSAQHRAPRLRRTIDQRERSAPAAATRRSHGPDRSRRRRPSIKRRPLSVGRARRRSRFSLLVDRHGAAADHAGFAECTGDDGVMIVAPPRALRWRQRRWSPLGPAGSL